VSAPKPLGDGGPRRTIIQIVAPGDVGGLESVVLTLAAGQTRRGHNVIVAVVSEPRTGEHPFVTALRAADIAVEAFVLSPRAYLKERALIRELCDRVQPDVVHTHGYRSDILHGALRFRRNFATATTLHGSSRVGGTSTFHEMLQLVSLRRFDAVIAVSRPLADALRGVWARADRLHLIPNAWSDRVTLLDSIEARRALGLPEREVVVGWVGRLIPIKGADIFLEAIRLLPSLPLTVSIIGDGPERSRLERFVRAEGLSNRVRFHGILPAAARYMKAFDVFVLSSRSEGTPVTLLEAIGAKVPVVASTVGGVPDVVGTGESVLVPPENPRALAAAIRSVVENRGVAKQRAEAALERLRANFDEKAWIDAHDRVYEAVMSR
jgi:glycosyltransferase involved in cell wall biosynthesis